MSQGAPAEKILIVRLSAMGDVLQTLPALAELRAARPEARIGWAVERRFASLLEGHPSIDRLFVFERRKGAGIAVNAGALARLRTELREWGPDIAVDAQGNLRGALVTRLSGAPRRLALPAGEAREGSWRLANQVVDASRDPREHRADRARRLLAPLMGDAARDHAEAPPPLLPPVPDAARRRTAEGLSALGLADCSFALLIAGTSDFGAFKRWPPAAFGELAQRLRDERGLAVLVSWGPGQQALADEIAAASAGAARPAPATADLHELRAQIEAAALVVGADSGPVVLAGLVGRPTVALFGPKDPAIYRPPGARSAAVWKRVYCAPCALRRCDDPICMTMLRTDEAWSGVARVLPDPRESVA